MPVAAAAVVAVVEVMMMSRVEEVGEEEVITTKCDFPCTFMGVRVCQGSLRLV
jgi:hypothetical protein